MVHYPQEAQVWAPELEHPKLKLRQQHPLVSSEA